MSKFQEQQDQFITKTRSKFQELEDQFLAKEAAYNNGELPSVEFIKFLADQCDIYRQVVKKIETNNK